MKYLIFDIECSNGNDMCSFGYVIADENFNVTEQNDILINPESKFVLTNKSGTQGITLAYEPKDFYSAPTFPHYYEKIKALIENPEYTIIGFAIGNDAGFIRRACERYGLKQIDFAFFDVQRLDAKIYCNHAIRSLSKALDYFTANVSEQNTLHKSDDDAKATLEIFKSIITDQRTDGASIIEKNPDCSGLSQNGNISYDGHPIGNADKMRKRDAIVFRSYCEKLRKENKNSSGALNGKKLCFARNFENKFYRKMIVLAEKIYSAGGKLVSLKQCNTFVSYGPQNAQTETAKDNNADIIELESLLSLLNITEEQLNSAAEKIEIMKLKKEADMLHEKFQKTTQKNRQTL